MQEEKKPNGAPPEKPPDYVGTFDPFAGSSGPPGVYQAPPKESGGHAFRKRARGEKSAQDEEHPC